MLLYLAVCRDGPAQMTSSLTPARPLVKADWVGFFCVKEDPPAAAGAPPASAAVILASLKRVLRRRKELLASDCEGEERQQPAGSCRLPAPEPGPRPAARSMVAFAP